MYPLIDLHAFIWLYLRYGFVCMSMLWEAWQTLSLLFFAVISTESGLQIMLSAWRCGRFSRMPQMEWRHLWVPQPVSPWYARTHTRTAAILLFCVCSFSAFDGISQVSGSVRREEMVLLATRLSQPEQQQLGRLGKLLGGRVVDTFSTSGRFKCSCNIKNISQLALWHHILWLPETRKSRITTAASQCSATVTDLLVQCQTLQ